MKKKARKATTESAAGAPDDEADVDAAPQIVLEDQNSDLCQKLMDRYANSSAPQHSHLCASAAAMRAILQEEGLPLTPLAYFAATISAIDDATASEVLDSDAIAALASFLSMLVPLVPSEAMPASKAVDAVAVLIRLLEKGLDGVGTATVRCVVKALGDLLVLCDLGDWEGIRSPFEVIVGLCFDKRPKVRRCAQMCVEKVFKSFNYSFVIKEACKVVLSLFDLQLPLALEFPTEKTGDASKNESDLKQENFKVLHTLNLVKLSVPYLSKKASSKIFLDILELLTCQFAPIVSHSLTILEAFFESSTAESIIPEAEKIIFSLVSLISSGEKYPRDTIVFASVLAKRVLGELHRKNLSAWIGNLPLVFCSIAGMLVLDANISTQAADILKDLVNNHIDMRFFHDCETQSDDGRALGTAESRSIESICVALENLLCSNRVPNGATLAVISDLFLKLGGSKEWGWGGLERATVELDDRIGPGGIGKISSIYMKGILVKLANVMLSNDEGADIMHLHDCIGSAVTAMGPEKTLAVIPISFQEESFTFSNIWLIPILKKYVVGTSLEYFIENIMPLVESLQRASHKVKKASLRKKLQTYLHELWDLLPAFCRYPTDTQKNFEPLSKIFADLLRKDSSMHENIALALQELVNQNKIIVQSSCNVDSVTHLVTCNVEQLKTAATSVPHHYSTKIATRNVKALSSCSNDLLQALADVFFDSPPEKRIVLKEAISCLASITKTSKVKRIFTSTLEKYRLTNGVGASEKLESVGLKSVDSKHQEYVNKEEGKAHQSIILEFSSSLVEGANEDLINMIFDYIRLALEDTSGVGQAEAYYTLSRIFKEHTWFISSRFDEMMNLLVGVNSPTDSLYLRSRFACMHDLFVHILQSDFEEKSSKAFLILNEPVVYLPVDSGN
ncbi:hypothetical protein Sjap_002320 [Stephania japonica]|uniref:Ribosomal RNA-processing protein 12-like conserved domain-containing protein n=1 Tax=Stephania japonica TaxID=461633 RepID=A0AAP0PU28_9MAGN